jgi:hypothetical protein
MRTALVSFAAALAGIGLTTMDAAAAPYACGSPKCEKKVIDGKDCEVCKTVMCERRPLPGGGTSEVIVGSQTSTSCTVPRRPPRADAGANPGTATVKRATGGPTVKSPRDSASGIATGKR